MKDPTALRLYKKALRNEIGIAVGSAMSQRDCAIDELGPEIERRFNVGFLVGSPIDYFVRWNEFIEAAEKVASREQLVDAVASRVRSAEPTEILQAIAHIPISNFIDTTFDRSLVKALHAAGRTPILHDFNRQMIGDWKQPPVTTPNVFFLLPNPLDPSPWFGLYEQSGRNNSIQHANISEMLRGKDLLLLDYSPAEAESILRLSALCLSGEKIFNYTEEADVDDPYWCHRGVMSVSQSAEVIVRELLPSQPGSYSFWDTLSPRRTILDVMRDKPHDCFISYFHGDIDFVRRLASDLDRRGVIIWRDETEIEIGDSLSQKIQAGLANSYSIAVVLSPEAVTRPWFQEELTTAFALRREGTLKIFPILHRDCDIPLFLRDYYYADFRNPDLYELRLGDLERAIRNTVARAQGKKD